MIQQGVHSAEAFAEKGIFTVCVGRVQTLFGKGRASAMPRKSRQRLPRCGHCCINRRTRRQHISFQISNFDACLPVFFSAGIFVSLRKPFKTSIPRRKAAVSFTMPPLLLFCFEFLRYTKNPNPSPIRNGFGFCWLTPLPEIDTIWRNIQTG